MDGKSRAALRDDGRRTLEQIRNNETFNVGRMKPAISTLVISVTGTK